MSGERKVVVVGSGVVGAASAYYLAKSGWRVTMVDRAGFGSGCSHANCGYVCPSHVLPLAAPGAIKSSMKAMKGRNAPLKIRAGVVLRNPSWFLGFARRCNRNDMLSAAVGIRSLLQSSRTLYDDLIQSEQLKCEWETKGLLFVFRTKEAMDHYAEIDHLLRDQFDTPAKRIEEAELLQREPALQSGVAGAWLYEGDAHLRPDRLMSELRRVLSHLGVEIHEHSPVTGLIREGGKVTGVTTSGADLRGDHLLFATGAWTTQLHREIGCKIPIQPGKGYSLTYARPAICPTYPMIFEEDRVAVTPFSSGFRIGSTMEFAGYNEEMNRKRLNYLTSAASGYLKQMPTEPAQEEWWGWRPMTPDGLPLIGRVPSHENVWVAAGHNMLGLSMATGTGRLISELIGGIKPHIDPAAYALGRF
jgi:D-amino-acid dehydrogenase